MAWIPVIGVLLVGLAGPPPPAPAIAQTCRGMPATIVGTPHQEVNGTAAADVIVTNGARFVYTRGGDDVVCTTSTPLDPRAVASVQVETGSGDDVVDTTGDTSAPSVTYLEGGDDRFYGGDQRDTVIDFDGKGADRVHLGAGSDLFYARSEPSPGTLDGGPGADILVADPGRRTGR